MLRVWSRPERGPPSLIGETHFRDVTDIAMTPDLALLAVTFERLLRVDPLSGQATAVGTSLGFPDVNALAADRDGRVFAATYSGDLLTVDVRTGSGSRIGPYGSGLLSSGDLAFSPDGILLATAKMGSTPTDVLVRVDPATGAASVIGDTAFPDIFGLSFGSDGRLYGTAYGPAGRTPVLIRIDPATAAATQVGALTGVNGMLGLTTDLRFMSPSSGRLTNGYSEFYGGADPDANQMHHAGLDLDGQYRVTPVPAAQIGRVVQIVGLVGMNGGPEEMITWSDLDGGGDIDADEFSERFPTGRADQNNHGYGITLLMDHGSSVYSLYAHLAAVRRDIYDAVLAGERPIITQGETVGVVGGSGGDNDLYWPNHLHYEVKRYPQPPGPEDGGCLSNPLADVTRPYFGYTPDLATGYGYVDPRDLEYPSPISTKGRVPVRIVGEETPLPESPVGCSTNIPDRGARIYTGPGVNYSVLGWTGLNHSFVATATASSGPPSDDTQRLWYRIEIPGRLGPVSGWVASRRSNGEPLTEVLPGDSVMRVTRDGVEIRLDPLVECADPWAGCVRTCDRDNGSSTCRYLPTFF